jgi:hypothetical protein
MFHKTHFKKLVRSKLLRRQLFLGISISFLYVLVPAYAQSYGQYDKVVSYFTSGKFCAKASLPENEMFLRASGTNSSKYYRNTYQGWYLGRLLDVTSEVQKSQLRAAYTVIQRELSRCGM